MEDDDEFGDLYTDVLRPFASSTPPPHQNSAATPPPPQSLRRPIDLNDLQNDDEGDDDGEGNENGHVFGAPASSIPGLTTGQTLAPAKPESVSGASNFRGGDAETSNLKEEEVTFDIEVGNLGIEDASATLIPGLESNSELPGGSRIDGGEDDWDSDESEDDLQIVLNGPMTVERGGGIGDDDDEDEDDELVIVADGDPSQVMEEQDWGEDATASAQAGDGKEAGEGGKVGGTVVPKVGYGSHGYHPFHSQFKYVRPGAQPIPGAATSGPGGVPGQIRPIANIGPTAGRGRGDWRPMGLKNSAPKNFHSGFSAWGNNASGRGFGGGLEFTLPSHKTIFDVDIDSFEEKPWKYPSADVSDFFNFGLNEDGWKDYCKQLEQHRLESTMQSKIRVYESGRAEQEYDPDLPPELAAATGIQEVPPEEANLLKSEDVQSDLPKMSARVRPPLPTGRAIQVEYGYGERLPSIDTRPPRMRDSDAIIEIVLQGSPGDDSPAEDGVPDQPDDDTPKADFGGTVDETETSPIDSEFHGKYTKIGTDQTREQVGQRSPFQNSVRSGIHGKDGDLPSPTESPARNGGSYVSGYRSGDLSPEYEEREAQGRSRDRSHIPPSQNARGRKYHNDEPGDSVGSMDSKHSPLSSPVIRREAHESSPDIREDSADQDDVVLAEGRPGEEKGGSTSNIKAATGIYEDGATKKQKSNYLEDSFDEEPDDGEDSRAGRSSDNSRARSGSSRDYTKRRDGIEEEVIQRHPKRVGIGKKQFDDKEQSIHRRNRDGRYELERNHMVVKGREDSYPYKEFDPSSIHTHMRTDGFERRKERDNPDGAWQRREDDSYGRRMRTEETRKRERSDEMGSRHRSKVREIERVDKDEPSYSRKQMDNGTHRVHHDKDVGPRLKERDDSLKGRHEHMDDYHVKRKKEEHMRREYDKEEVLLGQRENTSRRKRERDEVLDQRKRDGQQRLGDNTDDHQSVRHKDESWMQRERGERGREREEWQRVRQSHEDNIPKRERDEGRGVTRGGRGSEDKVWAGHPKLKDESKGSDKDYQYKETVRHGEPSKRRDRTENESSSHHGGRADVYARGTPMSNGERRLKQERPRNDRSVIAPDDKKNKYSITRNKEFEGGDNNTSVSSKRNQEYNSSQSNDTGIRGNTEQGFCEQNIPAQQRQPSNRQREEASDDEQQQQQESRRGRSKLERWTSHRERDFPLKSKPSPFKETDKNTNNVSLEESKIPDEPAPKLVVDTQQALAEERDSTTDLEGKDSDAKPLDERHLDTVEKLKKRSERFKLPMPSDKEASATKKVESEPLAASTKTGTQVDSEVKQERPARKRRWISN